MDHPNPQYSVHNQMEPVVRDVEMKSLVVTTAVVVDVTAVVMDFVVVVVDGVVGAAAVQAGGVGFQEMPVSRLDPGNVNGTRGRRSLLGSDLVHSPHPTGCPRTDSGDAQQLMSA